MATQLRIVPNRESAIPLLGAVLLERHEQWVTGHRYFDMAPYWQWRQAERARAAAAVTAGATGRATQLAEPSA